ncbi:MAG: glutamine synthetase [Neisseriaceae bacterium]|nr:glutamine synthetase [Neisseriaceae bacterium]
METAINAHRDRAVADLRQLIASRDIKHVKVGFFDLDGVMAGKYMATEKFLSALDDHFAFCDVVFGWDVNDELFDNINLSGWATGYADAQVQLLPELWRELPMEQGTILVPGQIIGHMKPLCPRQILNKVLQRARDMGFETAAGFEYELLVTNEAHESLRARDFDQPIPLGHGPFGYSILRTGVNNDFYEGLLGVCNGMGIPVESFHEETGPGQLEVALQVMETSLAADNAAMFKTFSKVLAQKQGRMVSFMAKWHQDYSGQGGHVHVSLKHADGSSAFYDASKPGNISDEMRWFVGGLQNMACDLMAIHAPTINSYRRLVPGYWAPTSALWGLDNRTTAIRAISGSPKSQRIEYRVPGADCNPYLVAAAIFAAGLHGIAHKIEPNKPYKGNAYAATPPAELTLPRSLWAAAQCLRDSKAAREWLGDDFVDHFASTREWEEREFQKHVSDWERRRYFEII